MLEDAPNRLFVSRVKGKYTHKVFVALKRGIGCTSRGELDSPLLPFGFSSPTASQHVLAFAAA